MKKCKYIGCQANRLRNAGSCFQHVKNPPQSRGFAQVQVNTTGASSYADTSGSITFSTGTSTTTTGGNIIWSGNSGTTGTWTIG